MLRRNSSRNKQRRPLGHSKSTNCITRKPVHSLSSIEPYTAERDAHIAANLSFNKAHSPAKSSSTMAVSRTGTASQGLRRSHSVTGRSDVTGIPGSASRCEGSTGACEFQGQQSVRFAGPNARPRKALATRASGNRVVHSAASMKKDVAGNEENQPPVTTSGNPGPDKMTLSRSQDLARQQFKSFYMSDKPIGPLPPAHKRLRKSKSMFTSSIPTTAESNSSDRLKDWLATPAHAPTNKKAGNGNAALGVRSLRAPKSMSFLRGRHEVAAASRKSNRTESDFISQLGRGKSHGIEESRSRLRSHPSMFFRSKNKRSESLVGLPRSMRNSSDNSAAISSAFSGDTISVSKQAVLRGAARKVSRSLKSKIKGLFGRSKGSDDTADQSPQPSQAPDSDGNSCAGDRPPFEEEASVCRVRSHVPSLHAVPSNQQMRSRQGSVGSVKNEEPQTADDKSRVTSWTNSTTDTVGCQGSHGDWERQRLSVIKENGMHISSSSRPVESQELILPASTLPPGVTVDSQRVYSALVKKLNETRQREEQQRKQIVENFKTNGFASPRGSSADRSSSRRWSPQTLRCVQGDDDVFQDCQEVRSSEIQTSEEIQESVPDSPGSVIRSRQRSDGSKASVSYKAYPNSVAGDCVGRSPEKRKSSRTDFDRSKSLSQRSSAFFASPDCHLFRTASPFRRALQETMQASQQAEHVKPPDLRYLSSLSALSLPTRCPSTVGSDRDTRMTYAESIYSSVTDDMRPGWGKDDTENDHTYLDTSTRQKHGDVTIFMDTPTYNPTPTHKRDISSASSVEWKTWLSANVSKLETPPTTMKTDLREQTPYAFPSFGHVREGAEIDSPAEALGPDGCSTPTIAGGRTPLKPMDGSPRHTSLNRATQKPGGHGLQPTVATDENFAPMTSDRSREPKSKLPPPIPSRSSLRTIPPLTTTKAAASGGNRHDGTKIPKMRSLNNLPQSSPLTRDAMLLQRRSRARLGFASPSSAKSSPGLTAAVERQFGNGNMGSPGLASRWSTELANNDPDPQADGHRGDTGLTGSEVDAQVMGSKRMVDLFLSSRRKRIEGSGTETGSENLSPAFT